MTSKIIFLTKIWIFFSTNCFVVIFAWSGEVTLKDLGEKEFLRLKGTIHSGP